MSHDMIKPAKWVCAQKKLRSAWASTQSDQSSLCARWVAKDKDLSFLHEDGEDFDQTGRMPRLIWVFAGRTLILFLSCRDSDGQSHVQTITTIRLTWTKRYWGAHRYEMKSIIVFYEERWSSSNWRRESQLGSRKTGLSPTPHSPVF